MMPSMIFSLILSIFLYEAQGIRVEKLNIPASNHQELTIKSSLGNLDDGSVMATKLSSGINRKLMTQLKPCSSTTANNKNYEKDLTAAIKFTRELVEKKDMFSTTLPLKHETTEVAPEPFTDVVDITGMDYSPAKRKPPIHN
ncbi:hypothetical protein E3N88_09175 [Mikania micrantha]|uniref:Uncharacterized protein n=1 Tax=Mikania micrantha TaxID=192012 RepID=A0A5N6PIA7_9ASTR|nr:hypothetical protein E3N88_09175 [Mikania micrantha]